MKKLYLALFLLTSFFCFSFPAQALGTFQISSSREVKLLDPVKDLSAEYPTPWGLRRLSPIWQYDVSNGLPGQKFNLRLSYDKTNELKAIFFYDRGARVWKFLGGVDYPEKKELRADTFLPFAPVAVFSYPNTLSSGQASWYSFKKGLFAASPDFPKGSKVRVTNLANNKSVVVTINDYGPDRRLHPQRAIDLDKVAFSRIASVSAGLINVKVEPLNLAWQGTVWPVEYKPQSESAVLYDPQEDKYLYSYQGDKIRPLASLTKVVAVKVFLDIPGNRERMDEVVSYRLADENYNYQYCQPWESARLRAKDGDQMKIRDLIYSSLVGSANNTVESLVRYSGLSRADFISQMNSWAILNGATNTHFVEPTGLSPENITTAKEYAKLASLATADPMISIPASTLKYSFNTHNLRNTNPLLESFKYSFVASKTGYLQEAGSCLMMSSKYSKGNLVAVVLGAKSASSSRQELEKLLQYGLIVKP